VQFLDMSYLFLPPSIDIETVYHSLSQKSCKVSISNSVIIPPLLTSVTITRRSLEHVFQMEETTKKSNLIKHKALAGYHLLNEDLQDKSKVYRFCVEQFDINACEGFIVNSTEHLPVYKTFFWGLNELETLQCWRESLESITKIEDSGTSWRIEGVSAAPPVRITSIVKKAKLELTTFFPTSNRSQDSRNSYEQQAKSLYFRYFFNPCYPRASTVDTSDASYLHTYFGIDGLNVQLKFVHLDARSIDSYMYFGVYMNNHKSLQCQDMKYGLLPTVVVDTIANDLDDLRQLHQNHKLELENVLSIQTKNNKMSSHQLQELYKSYTVSMCASFLPSRRIEILQVVDKIYLPIETLQKVFFDGNKRFPDCLNRLQILDKLKEAIANYIQLMHEDFQETVWEDLDLTQWVQPTSEALQNDPFSPAWLPLERDSNTTGTAWDYFGGPVFPPSVSVNPSNKYALEMMHKNLTFGGDFSMGDHQNIPSSLPVPQIGVHSADHTVAHLNLYSNGTCFMDTWEFNVRLDLLSGNIVDFGIALGSKFFLNAMRPSFKLMSI
jgi:hypothetical protein